MLLSIHDHLSQATNKPIFQFYFASLLAHKFIYEQEEDSYSYFDSTIWHFYANIKWLYSVVVITFGFDPNNPGSNPGTTFFFVFLPHTATNSKIESISPTNKANVCWMLGNLLMYKGSEITMPFQKRMFALLKGYYGMVFFTKSIFVYNAFF